MMNEALCAEAESRGTERKLVDISGPSRAFVVVSRVLRWTNCKPVKDVK